MLGAEQKLLPCTVVMIVKNNKYTTIIKIQSDTLKILKVFNLEYLPRIQEDIGYLLSCLEDLPSATYSDGTFYHGTRQYRENHKNGITASSLITETKGGTPKHKPRPPNTDQDYETLEERLAKARKHEQPYIVWNYETGKKE